MTGTDGTGSKNEMKLLRPRLGNVTETFFLWAQRTFVFILTLLVGWVVYRLALAEIDDGGRQLWPFLVIWVLASYVLLPRLNRLLARIYVPSYFIGRTTTSDGLLGDPINLAVVGTPELLRSSMLSAGWSEPDPVTLRSSWHIIRAALLHRSYPNAPVSPLFVFQQKQDLAFEREVAGSPPNAIMSGFGSARPVGSCRAASPWTWWVQRHLTAGWASRCSPFRSPTRLPVTRMRNGIW